MNTSIRKIARRAGLYVRRSKGMPFGADLVHDLSRLAIISRNPIVFDVGANAGQFAKRFLNSCPNARITCFEPGATAFEELESTLGKKVRLENLALGEKQGNIKLYRHRMDYSTHYTTILDPIYAAYSPDDYVNVPLTTVDVYMREQSISELDLLKLDVEGGELSVINGASAALESKRIKHILSEVTFKKPAARNDLYAPNTLFADVYEAMEKYGYTFTALYNECVLRKTANLLFGSALFSRPLNDE